MAQSFNPGALLPDDPRKMPDLPLSRTAANFSDSFSKRTYASVRLLWSRTAKQASNSSTAGGNGGCGPGIGGFGDGGNGGFGSSIAVVCFSASLLFTATETVSMSPLTAN
jgi:hypothetical protein